VVEGANHPFAFSDVFWLGHDRLRSRDFHLQTRPSRWQVMHCLTPFEYSAAASASSSPAAITGKVKARQAAHKSKATILWILKFLCVLLIIVLTL